MGRERSRSRSRSRSPRRKERRRSRSPRDRKQPDKKLDKFGRDISRTGEGPSSSSSRKRESREQPRDSNRGGGRDEDRGAPGGGARDRGGPGGYSGSGGGGGGSGGAVSFSYYEDSTSRESEPVDERRQKIKEMFMEQEEELDEDTKRMSQFMGITSFDSTKGKKVNDQTKGYAKINRTQRYRQYMNRRGGFNRPLDWVQ